MRGYRWRCCAFWRGEDFLCLCLWCWCLRWGVVRTRILRLLRLLRLLILLLQGLWHGRSNRLLLVRALDEGGVDKVLGPVRDAGFPALDQSGGFYGQGAGHFLQVFLREAVAPTPLRLQLPVLLHVIFHRLHGLTVPHVYAGPPARNILRHHLRPTPQHYRV